MKIDTRNIRHGYIVPAENYCDQVYVVRTNDDAWLAVMTTGLGGEGAKGQHVISMRSKDHGRTWSDAVSLEPPNSPESSFAVLFKTPTGRIYAFYNHNTDNVEEVLGENGERIHRVDSLGHYVFKYSDDNGVTWSAKRYDVPVRLFEVDEKNTHQGKVRFFWSVGRPLILDGTMVLPHVKVGALGLGFYAQSEGAFLSSDNICTEKDPEKLRFETLPEGKIGLRTPPGGGRNAEEQSLVCLSDGSLYCVYRTIDGFSVGTYSRDGGKTWDAPAYKTYELNGRKVKNPRAANFAWKCANGKYLYWYHFNGGNENARGDWNGAEPYNDRNPCWLSAGHEVETPVGKRLNWSEPEIVLYDDDPFIRLSYPDLIEENGSFFITETQKSVARVHEIDSKLLELLFRQHEINEVATDGLCVDLTTGIEATVDIPELPEFFARDEGSEGHGGVNTRNGVSLEFQFLLETWEIGMVLFNSRDRFERGIRVSTADEGRIVVEFGDGQTQGVWTSDQGSFSSTTAQHLVVIFDSGPRIVSILANGILCDGGDDRQFGWGRFSPYLKHVNGSSQAVLVPEAVLLFRAYGRALQTSEAVGNWRDSLERIARPRRQSKSRRLHSTPLHISSTLN